MAKQKRNLHYSECYKCSATGTIPHPTKWMEGKTKTCPRCKGHGTTTAIY